jgi:hypothetical protein
VHLIYPDKRTKIEIVLKIRPVMTTGRIFSTIDFWQIFRLIADR